MSDGPEQSGLGERAEQDKIAQGRFYIMNMVRLSGAVCVVMGLMIAGETVNWPIELGYILLIIGLADFFVIPPLLAKRWRSPD